MNNKFKTALKNIMYASIANGISLMISLLLTLLIPKLFSVRQYGYWQLYTLYISFVGFFHLGIVNGIYLEYGGVEYGKLPRDEFRSLFRALNLLEVIFALIIFAFAFQLVLDENKKFVICGFAVCMVVHNAKEYAINIFQITNQMRDYAKFIKFDRYIFFIVTVFALFLGVREFQTLIVLDIFSKMISMVYALSKVKELIHGQGLKFKNLVGKLKEYIVSGSKIMFASITALLITGIVRQVVELYWNIEVYAKISLTFSISSMVMVFVNIVGQILYPMLRMTNKEKYGEIYIAIKNVITWVMFTMLIFYYPLKQLIVMWLPNYSDALKYMILLLPMCFYECEFSMVDKIVLQVIRKEKYVLYTNIVALFITGVFITISLALDCLWMIVAGLSVSVMIKDLIAELVIRKYIQTDSGKKYWDLILNGIFVVFLYFVNELAGAVLYLLFYILFLLIYRSDISKCKDYLDKIIKKERN